MSRRWVWAAIALSVLVGAVWWLLARRGAGLPDRIDWRREAPNFLPPVGNQGDSKSCVAWAIGELATFHRARWLRPADSPSGNPGDRISAMWLYGLAQQREGVCGFTPGKPASLLHLQPVLSLLKSFGAASEKTAPFVSNHCLIPLSKSLVEAADSRNDFCSLDVGWTLLDSNSVGDDETILQRWLVENGPLAMMLYTTDDFECLTKSCHLRPKSPLISSHAMLCIGYDREREDGCDESKHKRRRESVFLFQNSWGSSWASGGYVWIPSDVLLAPKLKTRLFQYAWGFSRPDAFPDGSPFPESPPTTQPTVPKCVETMPDYKFPAAWTTGVSDWTEETPKTGCKGSPLAPVAERVDSIAYRLVTDETVATIRAPEIPGVASAREFKVIWPSEPPLREPAKAGIPWVDPSGYHFEDEDPDRDAVGVRVYRRKLVVTDVEKLPRPIEFPIAVVAPDGSPYARRLVTVSRVLSTHR